MRKAIAAVRQPDWNGKAVYYMVDDLNQHIATMVWDHFSSQFQCNYHAQDQWNEQVRHWQYLIEQAQPEGWFHWPSTDPEACHD